MNFQLRKRFGLTALVVSAWLAIESHATAQTGSATTNVESVCTLSGPVGSVLVQPDGKIVMAGGGNISFWMPESGALGCLNCTVARFHPDGALDTGFGCSAAPPSYSSVFDAHLSIRSDGRLLLTGIFNTVDGQPRSRVARLMPNGKLDEEFIPWRDGTNNLWLARPFSPPQFYPAVFDTNGRIAFPAIGRSATNGGMRIFEMDDFGRVLGASTAPTNWPYSERFLSLLSERGLWLWRPVNWEHAERTEWSLNPPKARYIWEFFQAANPLSAGDAAEVIKVIFAELPLKLCRNAVRLPEGGAILLVREGDMGRFMRFDKNWQADLSYTNSLRARGYLSLALQSDGRLLAARGSDLRDLATGNSPGVVRVNTNGVIDRSFRCDTDECVMCLAVQSDGKILIGGFFHKVNGVEAPFFARLNADGSVDETFQRRFTNFVGLMKGRRVPVTSMAAVPRAATASPAVSVQPISSEPAHTIAIQSLTMVEGTAVLQFMGAPARDYILQACNALDAGEWFNVTTNRTDARGMGMLRDAGAKGSPVRFYRVAAP